MAGLTDLLREQQVYYGHRSRDWDRWIENYMRPVQDQIDALLESCPLGEDILDLACGTGFWTSRLAARANSVTALDGSEAMLDGVRRRGLPNAHPVQADLFDWHPPTQWDGVFFAHWLAHVPLSRFDTFWRTVDSALLPGGTVAVVDVTPTERRIEEDLRQQDDLALTRRRLKDGQRFDVVKHFWDPDDLLQRLGRLGWAGTATRVGEEHGMGFVFYELRRSRDEQ